MIRYQLFFAAALGCCSVASASITTSAVDDFSNTTNTATSEWSYRWSPDSVRDGDYPLLATNSDPATLWTPTTPYWNNGGSLPGVGVNQSGSAINISPPFLPFSWPTDTIWMHPPSTGFAVVTWTSPVTGTADIEFEFDDMDPNGAFANGVRWYVDVGDVSGSLANGSFVGGTGIMPMTVTDVAVNSGEQVHFIVDPFGDFSFDSTAFRATVTYVPEPASMALLGLGAASLFVTNRKSLCGPRAA
ncbi:PEP-CTERM sorting domain-containing protein [Adhaeretor mobilis]|uniref:Ice-binding protein C-terminal domain-containing protein n=1 Tax=Adhaeretor mobilis TaxID=1930276 RepID=A0A517MSL0_9BACT|nr:PEP-CTERM sorting domain-containing protein [Adhaeretor mobilis]QDS97861.1 hypothetical protein HG15A2_11290 [Adhaeretor mobilis]